MESNHVNQWHTNSKHRDKEIMAILLYTIASKKIKYLRTNLTKEVKGLYNENIKPLNKDSERHQKIKTIPVLLDWPK